MAVNSDIEWTDTTWNPVTGCNKVSAGCKNCYAEKRAERNYHLGVGRIRKQLEAGKTNIKPDRYRNGFQLTLHPDLIEKPLSWLKPMRIFVNSMSDLFHDDIPFDFIKSIFHTMERAHWHQFQILTKRSDRLRCDAGHLKWPPNVWQGVSVEDARVLERIDHLRQVPAAVRFLSCEPLLGPLPRPGGWIPEQQVDAPSATVVARWVDPGTTQTGYKRLLEECEQLTRACQAALDRCGPAPAQEELFDAMRLVEIGLEHSKIATKPKSKRNGKS